MQFRLGELFCGPGGIAYGALSAKVLKGREIFSIRPLWANDFDKDTCETYKNNILPDTKKTVLNKDIKKLELAKLDPIDALAFGFPCNDFSIVGEQKGINGVYGFLYLYGIKALRLFKPLWFLAENVGGLKNANEGKAFDNILKDMFDEGYDVFPNLYKFENYGVPQARHRIIIVGIKRNLQLEYKVPAFTVDKPITCKDAIENPPLHPNMANSELTRQSQQVIDRLKFIKPGENAFTAEMPENLRLKVKGAKISQIYKRLDPNKPAYTITGSGGGGTHVYHWDEHRALTNRERARLQTFPDNFIFHGSKESVRKQIGMAVPPMAAKIIFEAILKTFAQIEYPSIEANLKKIVHNNASKMSEQQELKSLNKLVLF